MLLTYPARCRPSSQADAKLVREVIAILSEQLISAASPFCLSFHILDYTQNFTEVSRGEK